MDSINHGVSSGSETFNLTAMSQKWWKCSMCIGEAVNFMTRQAKGDIPDNTEPPEIKDAVTLAPSWQSNSVAGNIMMACVTLPTCMEHIQVSELSAEQRAVLGGILLGRPGQAV